MRRILGMALLVMLATSLSFAQAAKSKSAAGGDVEKKIAALQEEGRQAALKGDSSWLEKNAADDYSAISSVGEYMSKSEAVSRMKSGTVKYEAIDVIDQKIHVYRAAAVFQGHARLKATREGKDIGGEYWGTWVWVNQNGAWKLAASETTRVPAEGAK